MDALDRQIVHCLQRDGRAPFRRIGEVLGVSEQTVARRYRALREGGTLRVLVLPYARAAGGQAWFARILCRPGSVDALAEGIAARPDVSWVSVTAGGSEVICVTQGTSDTGSGTALLDRLPRAAQVLRFDAFKAMHLYAGSEAEWLAFDDPLTDAQIAALLAEGAGSGAAPAPRTDPARLLAEDGPLLAELAKDGRAGVTALASVTGWPRSRVAARLGELLGSGLVRIEIDLVPELFGFAATAFLWLTVAPGELEETGRALSRHPETSFTVAVTGRANLLTAAVCRDTDALYTYVTTKVGALPAVSQAEVVPVLRQVKQGGTLLRDGRLDLRA